MRICQLSMTLITSSPAVTSLSHAFLPISNLAASHLRPRLQPPSISLPSAAAASSTVGDLPSGITRRASILAILPFLVFPSPAVASPSDDGDGGDLERYTDRAEGFTLLIPPSWVKVLFFLQFRSFQFPFLNFTTLMT